MTELQVIEHKQTALSTERRRISEQARKYAEESKAASTRKAYRTDWKDFCKWCEQNEETALPATPETVSDYLTFLATEKKRKASTIQRRISSISQAHQMAGFDSPTRTQQVRMVWAGIKRNIGTHYTRKEPITKEEAHKIGQAIPDTLTGIRDRALLFLGLCGMFRRSELAALTVDDLEFTRDCVIVTVQRSKTDQEGQGQQKRIFYQSNPRVCPVRALQEWMDAAGITAGPIFRPTHTGRPGDKALSTRSIANTVKRYAEKIGLDPARFSGHSLRAGGITTAKLNGAAEVDIARMSGHKSMQTLRIYMRHADDIQNNASVGML